MSVSEDDLLPPSHEHQWKAVQPTADAIPVVKCTVCNRSLQEITGYGMQQMKDQQLNNFLEKLLSTADVEDENVEIEFEIRFPEIAKEEWLRAYQNFSQYPGRLQHTRDRVTFAGNYRHIDPPGEWQLKTRVLVEDWAGKRLSLSSERSGVKPDDAGVTTFRRDRDRLIWTPDEQRPQFEVALTKVQTGKGKFEYELEIEFKLDNIQPTVDALSAVVKNAVGLVELQMTVKPKDDVNKLQTDHDVSRLVLPTDNSHWKPLNPDWPYHPSEGGPSDDILSNCWEEILQHPDEDVSKLNEKLLSVGFERVNVYSTDKPVSRVWKQFQGENALRFYRTLKEAIWQRTKADHGFRNYLLSTGNRYLVYTNVDSKFEVLSAKKVGVDKYEGANMLGRVLMEIRAELLRRSLRHQQALADLSTFTDKVVLYALYQRLARNRVLLNLHRYHTFLELYNSPSFVDLKQMMYKVSWLIRQLPKGSSVEQKKRVILANMLPWLGVSDPRRFEEVFARLPLNVQRAHPDLVTAMRPHYFSDQPSEEMKLMDGFLLETFDYDAAKITAFVEEVLAQPESSDMGLSTLMSEFLRAENMPQLPSDMSSGGSSDRSSDRSSDSLNLARLKYGPLLGQYLRLQQTFPTDQTVSFYEGNLVPSSRLRIADKFFLGRPAEQTLKQRMRRKQGPENVTINVVPAGFTEYSQPELKGVQPVDFTVQDVAEWLRHSGQQSILERVDIENNDVDLDTLIDMLAKGVKASDFNKMIQSADEQRKAVELKKKKVVVEDDHDDDEQKMDSISIARGRLMEEIHQLENEVPESVPEMDARNNQIQILRNMDQALRGVEDAEAEDARKEKAEIKQVEREKDSFTKQLQNAPVLEDVNVVLDMTQPIYTRLPHYQRLVDALQTATGEQRRNILEEMQEWARAYETGDVQSLGYFQQLQTQLTDQMGMNIDSLQKDMDDLVLTFSRRGQIRGDYMKTPEYTQYVRELQEAVTDDDRVRIQKRIEDLKTSFEKTQFRLRRLWQTLANLARQSEVPLGVMKALLSHSTTTLEMLNAEFKRSEEDLNQRKLAKEENDVKFLIGEKLLELLRKGVEVVNLGGINLTPERAFEITRLIRDISPENLRNAQERLIDQHEKYNLSQADATRVIPFVIDTFLRYHQEGIPPGGWDPLLLLEHSYVVHAVDKDLVDLVNRVYQQAQKAIGEWQGRVATGYDVWVHLDELLNGELGLQEAMKQFVLKNSKVEGVGAAPKLDQRVAKSLNRAIASVMAHEKDLTTEVNLANLTLANATKEYLLAEGRLFRDPANPFSLSEEDRQYWVMFGQKGLADNVYDIDPAWNPKMVDLWQPIVNAFKHSDEYQQYLEFHRTHKSPSLTGLINHYGIAEDVMSEQQVSRAQFEHMLGNAVRVAHEEQLKQLWKHVRPVMRQFLYELVRTNQPGAVRAQQEQSIGHMPNVSVSTLKRKHAQLKTQLRLLSQKKKNVAIQERIDNVNSELVDVESQLKAARSFLTYNTHLDPFWRWVLAQNPTDPTLFEKLRESTVWSNFVNLFDDVQEGRPRSDVNRDVLSPLAKTPLPNNPALLSDVESFIQQQVQTLSKEKFFGPISTSNAKSLVNQLEPRIESQVTEYFRTTPHHLQANGLIADAVVDQLSDIDVYFPKRDAGIESEKHAEDGVINTTGVAVKEFNNLSVLSWVNTKYLFTVPFYPERGARSLPESTTEAIKKYVPGVLDNRQLDFDDRRVMTYYSVYEYVYTHMTLYFVQNLLHVYNLSYNPQKLLRTLVVHDLPDWHAVEFENYQHYLREFVFHTVSTRCPMAVREKFQESTTIVGVQPQPYLLLVATSPMPIVYHSADDNILGKVKNMDSYDVLGTTMTQVRREWIRELKREWGMDEEEVVRQARLLTADVRVTDLTEAVDANCLRGKGRELVYMIHTFCVLVLGQAKTAAVTLEAARFVVNQLYQKCGVKLVGVVAEMSTDWRHDMLNFSSTIGAKGVDGTILNLIWTYVYKHCVASATEIEQPPADRLKRLTSERDAILARYPDELQFYPTFGEVANVFRPQDAPQVQTIFTLEDYLQYVSLQQPPIEPTQFKKTTIIPAHPVPARQQASRVARCHVAGCQRVATFRPQWENDLGTDPWYCAEHKEMANEMYDKKPVKWLEVLPMQYPFIDTTSRLGDFLAGIEPKRMTITDPNLNPFRYVIREDEMGANEQLRRDWKRLQHLSVELGKLHRQMNKPVWEQGLTLTSLCFTQVLITIRKFIGTTFALSENVLEFVWHLLSVAQHAKEITTTLIEDRPFVDAVAAMMIKVFGEHNPDIVTSFCTFVDDVAVHPDNEKRVWYFLNLPSLVAKRVKRVEPTDEEGYEEAADEAGDDQEDFEAQEIDYDEAEED